MKKQLHLRIESEIYEKLQEECTTLGLTLNDGLEIAIRQFLSKNTVKTAPDTFTFIDLNCGLGGMSLAMREAGNVCVFSFERDKYARQSYFTNLETEPEGFLQRAGEIPEHDILCASLRLRDFKDREEVLSMILKTLESKRPKALILEATKNILSHRAAETFTWITDQLEDLDYTVFFEELQTENYVPQKNSRVVLVAFDRKRYNGYLSFDFPRKKAIPAVLGDILEDEVDGKYALSDKMWNYYKELNNVEDLPELDGLSGALTPRYYKDGFEILVRGDENPRRLTPRECARLQGFPDSYKTPISDSQAYRLFGDAVIVPMMSEIVARVNAKLVELEREKNRIYEIEYII